jgi:hypothetical protein
MSFAEQARLVGQYGMVVVAHGAGETSLAFLPRRSVVIEIAPYQMWCPIYQRLLTNMGAQEGRKGGRAAVVAIVPTHPPPRPPPVRSPPLPDPVAAQGTAARLGVRLRTTGWP